MINLSGFVFARHCISIYGLYELYIPDQYHN